MYDLLIIIAPVKLFSLISTQRFDPGTIYICAMVYHLYISKAAYVHIHHRIQHFVTIEKFNIKGLSNVFKK